MRKPTSLVLTLLCALAFLTAACGAAATDPPSQYVCPMSEHPEVFDHPGACPICGMELVPKGSSERKTRVAILVFDGLQLIDFTAPYEVFGGTPFEVFTVGSGAPARVGGGLAITPTYRFADSPQADLVIVPGGRIPLASTETLAWLRTQAPKAKIVMSICNGAFLLAKAGLLDGLSATTTYGHLAELARDYPKTKVVRDRRYVDNGQIVTTGGLTAGMDGSLHLVERTLGAAAARKIALDLEYHWQPEAPWTRPSLADRFLPRLDPTGLPPIEMVSSEGDPSRWKVELATPAPPSPELLDQLDQKLRTLTRWPAEGTAASGERRYRFEDEERHPWSARLSLQPAVAGGGSRILFDLQRTP